MKSRSTGLVYSTEHGRMCPGCGQPVAQCACAKAVTVPGGDGIVRVSLDTKGRKGKGVTVVTGVALDAVALARLAKELKAACGSGGTVKDGVIEIQGDHRELLIARLQGLGMKVKRAGG
jgi:translation initiation factor 1